MYYCYILYQQKLETRGHFYLFKLCAEIKLQIILQTDGGALKIYSNSGAVATVDPVFDRVIFFWSDRRNPHEVMPAYRERF